MFHPVHKVPVYDQHLHKDNCGPDALKTSEENYWGLFTSCSRCLSGYFLNKVEIGNGETAHLLNNYLHTFAKARKNK
jgi:hypothetical protein